MCRALGKTFTDLPFGNVTFRNVLSGTGTPPAVAPATPMTSSPAPAQAPGGAPATGQLALTFTAAFPASGQSAALNLSSALQTNAAQVLLPVSVKHGPLTISGA